MEGFVEAFIAAQEAQDAYVAALPQWVQYWMYWMLAVLGIGSLVFSFFRSEARWLLLAFFLSIVATMGLGMAVGWNKLWGVTHLVFWTPVAVLFIRRWGQIDKKSVYGVWFVAALATMIVSLLFDAKDVVEYFLGV
ncbi:MAG: hypothetical protein Q8K13_18875 [Parvibaculum sp.]|uniref:hypothetical protein n=1 Tax=Parvibaculum sp. TaxID=2024848 RepID=UPI002731EB2B|nr:hypothetical protein [Parvibaculum sp.]MDP2151698.1 hypothetical protein [Parvibaculum sp.]